ncbi:hypothetical protein GALMADRAFT_236334 [Galerina marginata CBS 339.88]|uniref:Uncharacterized protein n=1 Tax=Galerina marginata (strain CBS 339.88) TaxID=685588 RepID=A0A067TXV4_GALM3|nr:hypothetical protein GALMADRAFT_236334 [Galerina marginata CBS 339.88]
MDRRPSYSNLNGSGPPMSAHGLSYEPHALDADYGPQTIHRSDLFFIDNSPHMNTRKSPDFSPSNTSASQLYPYHQQAFHHHFAQNPPPPSHPPSYANNVHPQYDHRQRATTLPARPPPPPLPPKPIVYPSIAHDEFPPRFVPPRPQLPYSPAHQTLPPPPNHAPPPPIPTPHPKLLPPPNHAPPLAPAVPVSHPPNEPPQESPVDDANELAMVLALSQSESTQRQKLEEELLQKEEEDLAKALAESMLSTGSNLQSSSNPFFGLAPIPDEAMIRPIPANIPEDISPSQSLPPTFGLPQEAAHATQTTSTDTAFSEFGRYDKWRIPGVSQVEEAPSELKRENSAPKRPSFSSSSADRDPPSTAARSSPPRPLSTASDSSLPYTQPSPVSNTFGAIPVHAQDGSDLPLRPSSPHVDPALPESSSVEPEPETVLVFDDEAYARQLAAEEEEWARQQLEQYPSAAEEKRRQQTIQDRPFEEERGLPVYSKDQPTSSQDLYPVQELAGPSSYRSVSHYGKGKQQDFEARPTISFSETSSSLPLSPVVYPSLGNRRESESDTHSDASHHSSARSTASAPTGHRPHQYAESQPKRPSFSEPSNRPPPDESMSDHAHYHPPHPSDERGPAKNHRLPPGVLNPNHFLDHKLLLGVAIGFTPPHISTELVPMQDSVPNLITLPYSRCPPLYVQAPDWSHLLRLMARLSTSRIEATVQAMAISKTELKLRTVIQFLKPHPASKEWRTMVWFTIDHPVPPSVPEAHRYLGNPNLLPWSYSQGSLPTLMRDNPDVNFQKHQTPMLLQDGRDTQISRIYTIPASETLPLPNLPITFPNLALYLQAALDYSRRHSSDGPGLGKLGKLVQTCYPSVEQVSEFDIPERSSMGGLLKRVMGRGNKDKKKGKGTSNEETYQLVTPFLPDEWGG